MCLHAFLIINKQVTGFVSHYLLFRDAPDCAGVCVYVFNTVCVLCVDLFAEELRVPHNEKTLKVRPDHRKKGIRRSDDGRYGERKKKTHVATQM